MRKIFNVIVIYSVLFQQIAWAFPLGWKPDFESASVLPCHKDASGHLWVLLSKKTYNDKEYDAPSWGDFGGKVEEGEKAVNAAVRELAEETGGAITATHEELLAAPFHQLDMKNSPFGEGVRRHTIFFKLMDKMITPEIEKGVEHGPNKDGGCEVSQYQWVSAKDLLDLQAPALFGNILGRYTPDALRIDSLTVRPKHEFFSIPFFALLQQTSVKALLLQKSVPNLRLSQTFSQIVFTHSGFQDWRLVHCGLIADPVTETDRTKAQEELDRIQHLDPTIFQERASSTPDVRLSLIHSPHLKEGAFYRYGPASPNFWELIMDSDAYRVDPYGKRITRRQEASQLMTSYSRFQSCLDELKVRFSKTQEKQAVRPLIPRALPDTMTDAHLKHLFDGSKDIDLGHTASLLEAYQTAVKRLRPYTKEVDSLTVPSFVKAVENVLKTERANPDMLTMYHGCAAEIHFLNTVYSQLRKMLSLPVRKVDWRLFDRSAHRYGTVAAAFADTTQSTLQETGYINPFEILVAGNAALTGNPEHDGCRTLTYWKKSHSEVSLDLNHVLKDVFKGIGVNSALADRWATELYKVYQALYYVYDPESTTSPPAKRPVGVLRQIFTSPEDVQDRLALSGWYFDTPLSFSDVTLPNGDKVSIYEGIEAGDNSWMKSLPPVLRFMTHIRMGHSHIMEGRIKDYHRRAPVNSRPFNLHDYEIRLHAGLEPTLVHTHYYPSAHDDKLKEGRVAESVLAIIESQLKKTDIPVRSFEEFYKRHRALRQIFHYQLGIDVTPVPVSIEQFKTAVAQGNLEVMELYLKDPKREETFEEVDIISGELRQFTLFDYMVMIAMRHHMAAGTIETAAIKFKVLSGVHPIETPYALSGLIGKNGLNALQCLGWEGSLDLPFRIAKGKESDKSAPASVTVAPIKEKSFSSEYVTLTVDDLLQPASTSQAAGFLADIAKETDYETLPSQFWRNLITKSKVDTFLKSDLMRVMTLAKWQIIVKKFVENGLSEEKFYKDNYSSILELFHSRITNTPDASEVHRHANITPEALNCILEGLVKFQDKEAILEKLKSFSHGFGLNLIEEEKGKAGLIFLPIDKYNIFKKSGLISPDWNHFSSNLWFVHGKERECFRDLIKIVEEGYPVPLHMFLAYPLEILQEFLGNPVLDKALSLEFEKYDFIQSNSSLSSEQKRVLYNHLYSLAYREHKLLNITLTPACGEEWFRKLPNIDQEAIVRGPQFSIRLAQSLGFPETYTAPGKIEEARRLIFFEEGRAIKLILEDKSCPTLDPATVAWLERLFEPYLPQAFVSFLKAPQAVDPFALSLFVAANSKVPSEASIDQLRVIASIVNGEAALLFSPSQIIQFLQDGYRFNFQYSLHNAYLAGSLGAYLQSIKEEVKAGLSHDGEGKENIKKMLEAENSAHMAPQMKEFLGFLVDEPGTKVESS